MPIANINGVNLYYEVAGKGRAIVLLHGSNNSSQSWVNQIPVLSPQYQVIALDYRGNGKSAAPSKEDEYSIKIFANDVFTLLKRLKVEKCCPVGHSLGGFVALQFALEHPDMLAGLVLVDTSSGRFTRPPGYAELRQELDGLARSRGMEAVFEFNIANNPLMRQRLLGHPEQREAMRQRMLMTSVDGYIYVEKAINKWPPVTTRLAAIKVPTLIFRGEDDLAFVEAVQTLQKGIAAAELVTVKGAGHSPHEETPAVFNETLLKFLDRVKW